MPRTPRKEKLVASLARIRVDIREAHDKSEAIMSRDWSNQFKAEALKLLIHDLHTSSTDMTIELFVEMRR